MTIPAKRNVFGVPYIWPQAFKIDKTGFRSPNQLGRKVRHRFTIEFNRFLRRHDPSLPTVENAFEFTSPEAVIFNYPNFGNEMSYDIPAQKIFCGSLLESEELADEWAQKLQTRSGHHPKILIAFGTFLSARVDVISKCISAIRRQYPAALIIAAAGGNSGRLREFEDEHTLIADFIPQRALLPHMDLVIHHGGCASFRETLFHEKPAIAFPFSSDQFNIAHDIDTQELGAALDPNNFNEAELQKHMSRCALRKV